MLLHIINNNWPSPMQNHNVRYTKCSGPQSLKKRMENRIGLKSTHCKDGNQMFATFGPMESYPILEKGFHSRDVCKKMNIFWLPRVTVSVLISNFL